MELMQSTNEILEQFFEERNLTKSTRNTYKHSVKQFEKVINSTLAQSFKIAEDEEKNGVTWKQSTLRKQLIKYRLYLFENYKKRTALVYLTNIKAIFYHFEFRLQKLPYFSLKSANESKPIYYKDLPTKEIIKKAVELGNPLMRSLILFLSSSGLSKVDALNITINTFIESTTEYHNETNTNKALKYLAETNEDIIPTWELRRQKTNKNFFTFSSPESTEAILTYLSTRENLNPTDKLFDAHIRNIGKYFQYLNDQMDLGKVGIYNRFRAHMLRKYHTSQLYRAGMAQDKIDLIQGRSQTSTHQSYFKEDPVALKEEYVKYLPYLVLDESKKYKTQLELEKEKTTHLKEVNRVKDEKMIILEHRLDKMESIFEDVDLKELQGLKRFLK